MTNRTQALLDAAQGYYTAGDVPWLDALSDEQAAQLQRLLTRDTVCPVCHGRFWIHEDRSVQRCPCFLERQGLARIRGAEIPARYAHCTLDSYVPHTPEQASALEMAREVIEQYPDAPIARSTNRYVPEASTAWYRAGLVLTGDVGVGKTHLAVGVLRALQTRHGVYGAFYTTSHLLQTLRAAYNPSLGTCDPQALTRAMTCDVLVLDDLGAEKLTEWVQDTIQTIIDARYTRCLRTILTTNHADLAIEAGDPNSLVARIGTRIRSRLGEMCEFLDVGGCDHRDLPPGATMEDIAKRAAKRTNRHAANVIHGPTKQLPRRIGQGVHATLRDDADAAQLKWPGGRGGNT